jgi:hypothetical protein
VSEYPTQRLPTQHGNDGGYFSEPGPLHPTPGGGALTADPDHRPGGAGKPARGGRPGNRHFANNEFATQIKQGFSSAGCDQLPVPHQVAARDFKDVITATGEKPGR